MNQAKPASIFNIAVIVAALGYFVDIYDLQLFGIIRVASLRDLGLTEDQIRIEGESILQWQMVGLMIGGVVAGIMGDKKGRLSVLFGSIVLYSLANIANGFVETVEQYKWIRFVAGLGLAGELGVGITLVSEITKKEKRGLATSLVAGIGLTGAVVAFIMKENFSWRVCYFIGGGLGMLLLILRISVYESGMFNAVKKSAVQRGNFLMLFNNWDRFKRYLFSILIGLPTWYVIGVLVYFSSDFAREFGITEKVDPGKAIMYAYAAISLGDILIGLVSQRLRSRKKALFIFYGITIVFMLLFFTIQWNGSAQKMYWICAGLGFGTGFWAIFVTMAAEQFGTNLRATAATTIPNMVRGTVVLMTTLFINFKQSFSVIDSGDLVGLLCFTIGLYSILTISETHNRDLDFLEE